MKQCQECGTFSSDETGFCCVCGKRFPEIVDVGSGGVKSNCPEIIPLLQRIELFLEDGEFSRADEYCERVLDIEPTNAEAYIDKLLIEFGCHTREQLKNCTSSIADSKNYAKVFRFGDEGQKAFLADTEKIIQGRLERAVKEVKCLSGGDQGEWDCGETDEYYIDIYCPFCFEELSYTNWQIKEGGLICPVCNEQFEYNEGIRRE